MHSVDEGLRGSFGMSMEFVAVLYAVDEGLHGRNILQSVVIA